MPPRRTESISPLLLTNPPANVDEAFIDLCRQMLRRDDSHDDLRDDPYPQRGVDDPEAKRRRRKKRKEKCTIL